MKLDQNVSQNDDRQPYFCKMIGNTTYVVRVHFSETAKETLEDNIIEPTDLVDPFVPDPIPRYNVLLGHKRIPAWVRQTLQDAKGHVAPNPFRETKKP